MDEPSGKNDSPYRLRRAKPLFVILRAKNRWRSTPDIEENISWTMTFPSGVLASCNSTYGAGMPGFYRVHGSQGMLHLENSSPEGSTSSPSSSRTNCEILSPLLMKGLISACLR